MTTHDRRATRRSDPIAFSDDGVKLRVWKPKEKGGAWRYSYKHPDTGRRVTGRFYGTRDEVRRQYKQLVKDLEAERTDEWRKVPFRKLAESYLAWPKHKWSASVRRGQTQKVGVLLDDTLLGTVNVGKLVHSATLIEEALDELAGRISPRTGRPYAQSSLGTYRDLVATIISWGQGRGRIPKELAPMKGVSAPAAAAGAKKPARQALRRDDEDDGKKLIKAYEVPSRDAALLLGKVWATRGGGHDPWIRELAVDLAATSGPRWGELHALQPRDVEWDDPAPYLRIDRKLDIDEKGSVIGYALPKMAKQRTALLSPHLHEPLRRRCGEVEARYGPTGLLFPSPMDPTRPYEPDSFGSSMRRFAKAADWPTDEFGLLLHTFHGLRHLACVWQLRDVGIDVVMVSRSMGHASVTFTQNRYLGETSDARELAMEKLKEYWS